MAIENMETSHARLQGKGLGWVGFGFGLGSGVCIVVCQPRGFG